MLAALIGPMLVFVTGIAVPLGIGLPKDLLTFTRISSFAHHWLGKGFLLVIISLFLWHAAHRIFHSLHDIGIHAGIGAKLMCYGTAFAGTVAAALALMAIGF